MKKRKKSKLARIRKQVAQNLPGRGKAAKKLKDWGNYFKSLANNRYKGK